MTVAYAARFLGNNTYNYACFNFGDDLLYVYPWQDNTASPYPRYYGIRVLRPDSPEIPIGGRGEYQNVLNVPCAPLLRPQQLVDLGGGRALILCGDTFDSPQLFMIQKNVDGSWTQVTDVLQLDVYSASSFSAPDGFVPGTLNPILVPSGDGHLYVVVIGEGSPDVWSDPNQANVFLRRKVFIGSNSVSTEAQWHEFSPRYDTAAWGAGRPLMQGAVIVGGSATSLARAVGYHTAGSLEGAWAITISGDTIDIQTIASQEIGPTGNPEQNTVTYPEGWRLGLKDGVTPLHLVGFNGSTKAAFPVADVAGLPYQALWNINWDNGGSVTQMFAPDGLLVAYKSTLYGVTPSGAAILETFTDVSSAVLAYDDWTTAYTTDDYWVLLVNDLNLGSGQFVFWVPRKKAARVPVLRTTAVGSGNHFVRPDVPGPIAVS